VPKHDVPKYDSACRLGLKWQLMPTNTDSSRRIFISFSNNLFSKTGGEIARRLRAEFHSAGFQTWMDNEEKRPVRGRTAEISR
jgi:hypothetical protein